MGGIRKTRTRPTLVCHDCDRPLRGIMDDRIGVERVPRHKDLNSFWCMGSGQPAEYEYKESDYG